MDSLSDLLIRREGGFATIANVVAAGMALLFFATLTNLIVMQYSLGVVVTALDEGARQGARSLDWQGACLARADATFSSIRDGSVLPGSDELTCSLNADGWVVARLEGTLDGWAPLVPDLDFVREARAPLEDLTP